MHLVHRLEVMLNELSLLLRKHPKLSYPFAILMVGLALWVRLSIAPIDAGLQYLTFFPAVALAALFGGFEAGMLATLFGGLLATYVFAPPHYSFSGDKLLHESLWANLVFLVDGLIVSFAIRALQTYRYKMQDEQARSSHREQALLTSEKKLEFAIHAAQVGLWEWHLDTGLMTHNQRWFELMDYRPDQTESNLADWKKAVHPEDLDEALKLRIACASGQLSEFECMYRVRQSDGQYRWVIDRGQVIISNEAGKPMRISGLIFDIQDQKIIEEKLVDIETRLSVIANNVKAVLFMKDLHGRYLYVNKEFVRLFSKSEQEVMGQTDFDLFPAAYAARFVEADRKIMFSGHQQELEEVVQMADGDHYYWSVKIPLKNQQGDVYGICGIAHDITEIKQQTHALKIASIAFETQEPIVITDHTFHIVRANHAFAQALGYTEQTLIGRQVFTMMARAEAEFPLQQSSLLAQSESGWAGELSCQRQDGVWFPSYTTITPVKGSDQSITNYVVVLNDISEQKARENQIMELAYFDALTGLPNRLLMNDRLNQAMLTGEREQAYGALLFIDIDNFKFINDTYGHDVGDQLLKKAAHRIQQSVRSVDTVARFGGDEFVVVLKRVHRQQKEAADIAREIVSQIVRNIADPYVLNEVEHRTSCSVGITLFKGSLQSTEELIKQADIALFKAKLAGKNGFSFYDIETEQAVRQRATLENDLHQALENQQFALYLQPQFNQKTLIGAEVLLRWNHPTLGLIQPLEFIGIAESSGMIVQIGSWVLRSACEILASWQDDPAFASLHLSVNVSARQFAAEDFVGHLLEITQSMSLRPGQLKVELTESVALSDLSNTIRKMLQLKKHGIPCSLDDFGTGYSSLSYLKKLPISEIKLDKSFIDDLQTDHVSLMIAKTVIQLSKELKLDVIAEGVESASQKELLQSVDCALFQGYYFGQPMPLAQFETSYRPPAMMAG